MKPITSIILGLLLVFTVMHPYEGEAKGSVTALQNPVVRDAQGVELGNVLVELTPSSLKQGDILIIRLPDFASFGSSVDTQVRKQFSSKSNRIVMPEFYRGQINWDGETPPFRVSVLDEHSFMIESLIDQNFNNDLVFYIQFGDIHIDSGAYGAINVAFEPAPGSGFPAGSATIGRVFGERTTFELRASDFEQDEDMMSFQLHIEEDQANALRQGKQLRVRLPQGFVWVGLDKPRTIHHDAGDLVIRANHSREISIERQSGNDAARASKWVAPLQFKAIDSTKMDSREIVLEFQWDQKHRLSIGTYEKPIIKEMIVFEIGKLTYSNNGVEQKIDVAPYIKNGRAYLPVRFVAEAVGVEEEHIVWNQSAQTVSMTAAGKSIRAKVGSNILILDGKEVMMDAAAEMKDGRVMLPIRHISEAFDKKIEWDPEKRTVTIEK